MNPIRKPTTEGTTKKYEFEVIGNKFLVKNLSGGDIFVGFSQELEGAESWLIPDGAWQVIPGAENRIRRTDVYVKACATSASDRGVEIEAIEFGLPRGEK